MKIIMGLGNPGNQYAKTRHNAGFLLLDHLVEALEKAGKENAHRQWQQSKKGQLLYRWFGDIELIKPQTFMNLSGKAASYVLKKHPQLKLEDVIVAYDDLDIALGSYKIQFGKSPKAHNGIISICQALGTDNFWHVRIGVDSRSGIRSQSGKEYVLTGFTGEEQQQLRQTLQEISQTLLSQFLETE